MKLNLDLEYGKSEESQKAESNSLTSINLIFLMLNAKYPQGTEGQLRRTVGRLQRKLDQAMEDKADSLELETAEVDLLKGLLDVKTPTNFSKFAMTLEDEIRAVAESKP